MAQLIIDLPHRVVALVLGLFLDIKSVGRLDSAFCSHNCRKSCLLLFASREVSLSLICDHINDIKRCMLWFDVRNAKLHRIQNWKSCEDLCANQLVKIFQRSSTSLQDVHSSYDTPIFAALSNITGSYSSLRTLHYRPKQLNCEVLTRILAKATDCLEDLTVVGQIAPADKANRFFWICCPHVKHIELFTDFKQEHLVGFDSCFPNLEVLETMTNFPSSYSGSYSYCGYNDEPKPIPAQATSDKSPYGYLPHLKSLSFTQDPSLTDDMMCSTVQRCPQLTHIEVNRCDKISEQAIITIAEQCTRLTTVNVSGSSTAYVTVAAATRIAECLGGRLTTLILQEGKLDSAALRALKHCTRLEVLDLTETTGMQAEDLCELFTSCTMLHTVTMNSIAVSDAVLVTIANHCIQLTTLSIAGSGVFTEVGILALADHAASLKCLKVGDEDKLVSPLAIAVMKKEYPKLSIERVYVPADWYYDYWQG